MQGGEQRAGAASSIRGRPSGLPGSEAAGMRERRRAEVADRAPCGLRALQLQGSDRSNEERSNARSKLRARALGPGEINGVYRIYIAPKTPSLCAYFLFVSCLEPGVQALWFV
jgi:hypothetical protein